MSDELFFVDFHRPKYRNGSSKETEHYASVFMIQPGRFKYHFYRVKKLKRNVHGQIHKYRLNERRKLLESKGFVQVKGKKLVSRERRPPYYYIICKHNHNYILRELTVYTTFDRNRSLLEACQRIPFQGVVDWALGEGFAKLKKKSGSRGNIRVDWGFTATSRVDKRTLPGHSIPTALRQCSTIPYVPPPGESVPEDVNLTMDHTTVDSIQDFYYAADLIADSTGEARLHHNPDRSRLWGARMARSFGVSPDYLRCDRASWLLTGAMPDFSTARVNPHVDSQDDDREGADESGCLSTVVPVMLPGRDSPVEVRAGLNTSFKAACGDVSESAALLEKVQEVMEDFMTAHPGVVAGVKEGVVDRDVMRWNSRNSKLDVKEVKENYRVQRAHANKSVHYSYFGNVIEQEIKPAFGGCKWTVYEAIYATVLCPSALGWKYGVNYAINHRHNGKNFIINWIEGMVKKFRHVGGGGYCRFMNSRNKKTMNLWRIYVSVYNIMRACENWSDESTDEVIKRMRSSPMQGFNVKRGVEGAGKFHAQQIIHICTMVGLMGNRTRCDDVDVAEGTETYNRLKTLSPGMEQIAGRVLSVLSHSLDIESLTVVENLLCEALRWHAGDRTDRLLKWDIVLKGGKLYQLRGGRLYVGYGGEGMEEVEFPKYENSANSRHYNPQVEWWALNLSDLESVLGVNSLVVLSKS